MYFRDQLIDYVCTGNVSGSFMFALLTGNLFEAVKKADDTNKLQIARLAEWILFHAPVGCYGTSAEVRRWNQYGGLQGKGGKETVIQWKTLNGIKV